MHAGFAVVDMVIAVAVVAVAVDKGGCGYCCCRGALGGIGSSPVPAAAAGSWCSTVDSTSMSFVRAGISRQVIEDLGYEFGCVMRKGVVA